MYFYILCKFCRVCRDFPKNRITKPKTSTTTGKLQCCQRKIVAIGNINTKKINWGNVIWQYQVKKHWMRQKLLLTFATSREDAKTAYSVSLVVTVGSATSKHLICEMF